MCDVYESLNIRDEDIIKQAVGDKPYVGLPLTQYGIHQLIELVCALIKMVRGLFLGQIGTPDEIQEKLDQLTFSAKKDSTTSGMRPSSDMYGRNSHSKGKTASSGCDAPQDESLPVDENGQDPNPAEGETQGTDKSQVKAADTSGSADTPKDSDEKTGTNPEK